MNCIIEKHLTLLGISRALVTNVINGVSHKISTSDSS